MKTLIYRLTSLFCIVLVAILPAIPVSADFSYTHVQTITITDTSGTDRSGVPVILQGISGASLLAAGYINSQGTNTAMNDSYTSSVNYMMDTSQVSTVVPFLPANGTVTYSLYMGTANQTSFSLIVGAGGYITTLDNSTLEGGANFQFDIDGYFDTTKTGNIISKSSAFVLSSDGTGSLTATMNYANGYTPGTLSVTASGVSSGVHSVRVKADGTDFAIYVDDLVTPASSTSQLVVNTVAAGSSMTPSGDGNTTDLGGYVLNAIGGLSWNQYSTIGYDYYTMSASGLASNATIIKVVASGQVVAASNSGQDVGSEYLGINPGSIVNAGSTTGTAPHTLTENFTGTWTTSEVDALIGIQGFQLAGSLGSPMAGGYFSLTPYYVTGYTAASMTNNSNSWTFLNSSTVPYATLIEETVGGTSELKYAPVSMLSGTTVPNVSTPNSYQGTITWGTNSNLTITYGSLVASPSVTTDDAVEITATSATLVGELNGMGNYSTINVSFEYGTTTSYGTNLVWTTLTSPGSFSNNVPGFSYGQTYHYRALSRAGTTTWYGLDKTFTTSAATGSSTDLRIVSAKFFNTYGTANDTLIVVEAINQYTSFFPNERPGDYFQIQLLDTDGSTILAANGVSNWGDRPSSIYLNPTESATLTPQGAYFIRMIGVGIVGTPSVTYNVTATDWKGSNLNYLDSWCIGTAKLMQITDNVSNYITSTTDRPEILSDYVGAYFTTGIPGISVIRPNLFNTNKVGGTYVIGTDANTWDNATAWQANIGSGITTDIATFAAPFGMQSRDFFGMGIWFVIILVVIMAISGSNGMKAMGTFVIMFPIIWVATYLKIFPSDPLIILFLVAILLFGSRFFMHLSL